MYFLLGREYPDISYQLNRIISVLRNIPSILFYMELNMDVLPENLSRNFQNIYIQYLCCLEEHCYKNILYHSALRFPLPRLRRDFCPTLFLFLPLSLVYRLFGSNILHSFLCRSIFYYSSYYQ